MTPPGLVVLASPVFGVGGELNAAARVTAEAERDLPSPPFSSRRQVIRNDKTSNAKVC